MKKQIAYTRGFHDGRRPITGVAKLRMQWTFNSPYSGVENTNYILGYKAGQRSLYGKALAPKDAFLQQILRDYSADVCKILNAPGAGERLREIFDATPKELADAANRARLREALQGKKYPLEEVLDEIKDREIKESLAGIPELNGWEY